MPYWKPIRVGAEEFSLTHLEPFTFVLTPNGWNKQAGVSVRFNDHCFTEKFDGARHDKPLISQHASNHEHRAFCPIRYELSKNLPAFVRGMDGKRVAQTREGNLVRIELANGANYGVFFTLRREDANRCGLFVVSAYPFEKSKKVVAITGEMRFNVAVALVLDGRRPKFPPRN
jgi:hypothetical protein